MSHECDECGRSFGTMTRLRLHECANIPGSTAVSTATESDASGESTTGNSRGYETSVAAIDEPLARVAEGDHDAIHEAVAGFEAVLAEASDEGGEAYRDVLWPYYERVSDALDAVVRAAGWPVLADVLVAYDPAVDEDTPRVTPVVENAVGRYVIRTLLSDGVAAIDPDALEYLYAVTVHASEYADLEREETHAFGWGIGHPGYAFRDRVHEWSEVEIFSLSAVLEHAFYADQYAAVDVLEELVTATVDQGSLRHHREGTVSHGRYLLGSVYGPATEDYWPTTPRHYDWHEEFDVTFELDESVEARIRDLVVDLGFDEQLPRDWDLQDLAF